MKKSICTVVFLVTVFLSFAQIPVTPTLPVNRSISVSGSAEMVFIPDQIFVSVEIKEYTIKNTKVNLDELKANFLNNCRKLSIPDSLITVSDYGGDDNYYYSWRKRKNPDMLSSVTYEVKFDNVSMLEKFASTLDEKAVEWFGITKTTHTRITEFRKQLKIQAIQACKAKASYLTEAIGEKIGEAITITEPKEYESGYDWYYNRRGNYASNTVSQTASSYGNTENGKPDFKKVKLRYEMEVVFSLK